MDWVEDVSHNSHIDHAFSGWYFNEIFQNVIHSFKYQGRPKFAFEFGCFLANEMLLQDGFDSMDCIIPVPLHSMKYRSRGYNQAYWIGKGVGVTLDIPVIRKGIVKTQHTSSQTSLNLEEREKNVAGVFKCKLDLSGMHVWIVDDVLTTGSTISSVAKACKSAGAKCVTALTLCTPKIKGKK